MTLPAWTDECRRLGMMSPADIEAALAAGWMRADIEAATSMTARGFSLANALLEHHRKVRQ